MSKLGITLTAFATALTAATAVLASPTTKETLPMKDATGKNGSLTGARLMDEGFDVPMGPNASEIIWIEKVRSDAGPTHK
jgi:hypothetical protein